MYIDNTWATQFKVLWRVCTRDYEMLSVSIRPFYLPREFGQITVILAYVPGPNNKEAAEAITDNYNAALSRSADQLVFTLGDFNTCQLSPYLPTLQQYVTTPTRSTRILDQCFGNIPDAYKSVNRPPLGKSDHNVIHLLPKYRQKVRREKPHLKTVQQWSEEGEEELRHCFDTTDWTMFFDTCADPQDLTDTITSYIKFCEDTIITTKTVKVFSNNKPWLSKDLKTCLNEKKLAFLRGEMDLVREKETEFRQRVFKAKIDFKNKIEQRFCSGNAKQAWDGLNVMMGREQNKQSINITDCSKFVNDLNTFYGRFDVRDPKAGCSTVCNQTGSYEPIQLSEEEVGRCLSRIKPNKAPGPDGLRGRVLKSCAQQLRGVITQLFQTLLDRCTFPNQWKKKHNNTCTQNPEGGGS